MPSAIIRRGVWAIGAVILGVALFLMVLPLIASTQIVRERVALEMSAWSGYRVELGSAPVLDVFPVFRATLDNVTLSDWRDPDEPPVIEAERVEVELSALAALVGNVVFSDVRLVRPTLRLTSKGSFYAPTPPDGGRVVRAVEAAKLVVGADPAKPDLGALPADPFGLVEFSDGRIVIHQDGKDAEVVTSLSGAVDWATVNRTGKLNATGIWRGESVALSLSSPTPLVLLAGGAAPLSLALKSNPATASFDGTVNTAADTYFDGQITFASPSLRRLLEWTQSPIAAKTAIGSVTLSSHLTGNAQRAKFDRTDLVLDGNPGSGVLDVSMAGIVPSIAGTLAFETLDLRSFLSALTPLSPDGGEFDTAFVDELALDLRLSAAKATAGTLGLIDVAATAQVKEGVAQLDISDAMAFGGSLQAGLRLDHNGPADLAELHVKAADVDGNILGAATGMTTLVPTGRGTVSLNLKGPAKSWPTLLENAEGEAEAKFGAGQIKGFDMAAFLKRAGQGGFFALSEVANGSLPVSSVLVKAKIANGLLRLETAQAKADGHDIWLSGLVPYVGGGLALSGRVMPAGSEPGKADAQATFFVGGSWSMPFVSPILSANIPPE